MYNLFHYKCIGCYTNSKDHKELLNNLKMLQGGVRVPESLILAGLPWVPSPFLLFCLSGYTLRQALWCNKKHQSSVLKEKLSSRFLNKCSVVNFKRLRAIFSAEIQHFTVTCSQHYIFSKRKVESICHTVFKEYCIQLQLSIWKQGVKIKKKKEK